MQLYTLAQALLVSSLIANRETRAQWGTLALFEEGLTYFICSYNSIFTVKSTINPLITTKLQADKDASKGIDFSEFAKLWEALHGEGEVTVMINKTKTKTKQNKQQFRLKLDTILGGIDTGNGI